MANTAAGKPLTKSQMLTALAETLDVTKKEAAEFVDALVGLAYKQAKVGFTIPGLGKLVLVDRKARMGRNPATGEEMVIPAKKAKDVLKTRIMKKIKVRVFGV